MANNRYVYFPGGVTAYVDTPYHADFESTSVYQIDIRFWAESLDNDPGFFLASSHSDDPETEAFYVQSSNQGWMSLTNNASTQVTNAPDATNPTIVREGREGWVRFIHDYSTQEAWFYDAYGGRADPDKVDWQLRAYRDTAGAFKPPFNPSVPIELGSFKQGQSTVLVGGIYEFRWQSDGVTAAHFKAGDFKVGDTATKSVVDEYGKTWTLRGAAEVRQTKPPQRWTPAVSKALLRDPRAHIRRNARRTKLTEEGERRRNA